MDELLVRPPHVLWGTMTRLPTRISLTEVFSTKGEVSARKNSYLVPKIDRCQSLVLGRFLVRDRTDAVLPIPSSEF